MAEPRKPTKQEQTFLEKAMAWGREKRDAAVNNKRQRDKEKKQTGTNKPTLRRTKKDIMKELT